METYLTALRKFGFFFVFFLSACVLRNAATDLSEAIPSKDP